MYRSIWFYPVSVETTSGHTNMDSCVVRLKVSNLISVTCYLTVTTRTARTVASARGRGRIGRGRGRGRRRNSSRGRGRGRGRGGRRSSTGGQSSSRKRKFKRRKKSKKKSSKTTKKRRIAEDDEVSPFIYEPQRRGKTVHARLLESLNSTGRSTEPARSATTGRIPFPCRVEPSCSFSLFGNAYALHDFDEGEENSQMASHKGDETTPLR